MISCQTKNGVEYITKLEHFRDIVEESTYEALVNFIEQNRYNFQERIDDLNAELEDVQSDLFDAEQHADYLEEALSKIQTRINDILNNEYSKEQIIEIIDDIRLLI